MRSGNNLINSINRVMDPQMHRDASKYIIYYLDTVSKSTINNYLSRVTPSLENKRYEVNELLNMIVVQQRNLRFGEEKLVKAENLAEELIMEFPEIVCPLFSTCMSMMMYFHGGWLV